MNISIDYNNSGLNQTDFEEISNLINKAHEKLLSKENYYTGWLDYPNTFDDSMLEEILSKARTCQSKCSAFVVVGIGGSYLGTKACYEMLKSTFKQRIQDTLPKIYFAGYSLSSMYHQDLIEEIKNEEICICVISKSGKTMEVDIAFSLLKELLIHKYENTYNEHIYVITENNDSPLNKELQENNYDYIYMPKEIGGRYSVLTAVGLFPLSVIGINIEDIIKGSQAAWRAFKDNSMENQCCQYAAARHLLYKQNKTMEIFAIFEPKLHFFCHWLIQLFGESEGKDQKGIFPTYQAYTTDLHAMGQFIQEGHPMFFETFLSITNKEQDLIVSDLAQDIAKNKSLNMINTLSLEGTMLAHTDAKVPNIRINIPELSPFYFGYLVYFFMKSCAISAYAFDVNPFNQPGVESYKKHIKNLLTTNE